MAATVRRQTSNRFDADAMPSAKSADTSISSVSTEPHGVAHGATEPTPRRRLSPVSCDGRSPDRCSPVRQNNPYMYNVLGEHASPDLQSRTSPVPPEHSNCSPVDASMNTTRPAPQRNLSMEWDEEPSPYVPRGQQGATEGISVPSTPVLGGYMAQAYCSAFPPGHGVTVGKPSVAMGEPASKAPRGGGNAKEPSFRRGRNRRDGASQGNSPLTATPQLSFPQTMEPHKSQSPSPGPATPASPTSPMMRVYRNGRPVPVPKPTAA